MFIHVLANNLPQKAQKLDCNCKEHNETKQLTKTRLSMKGVISGDMIHSYGQKSHICILLEMGLTLP